MLAVVGDARLPSDFDEWESLGAEGWGWEGVLPYFNRLENDRDFDGPLHGKDGPVPIRRLPRNEWPPFVTAVADEIEAQGYAFHPDCNGYFGDSLTIVPMNNTPERRVSATMAYLDAETRLRPNLTIMTDTVVERLLFDARRVMGVTAVQNDKRTRFLARETIVSAGATPASAGGSALGTQDNVGFDQALLPKPVQSQRLRSSKRPMPWRHRAEQGKLCPAWHPER